MKMAGHLWNGNGSPGSMDHRDQWIIGINGSPGSMDHRDQWIIGINGSPGSMDHRDQWIIGINGSPGSMDHRDQWITGINGSPGSMDHRDQWITGINGSPGSMDHRDLIDSIIITMKTSAFAHSEGCFCSDSWNGFRASDRPACCRSFCSPPSATSESSRIKQRHVNNKHYMEGHFWHIASTRSTQSVMCVKILNVRRKNLSIYRECDSIEPRIPRRIRPFQDRAENRSSWICRVPGTC